MKSLLTAVAATALLASGLIFAEESRQALPQVEEAQRQAGLAALADPDKFREDICWTAPDLQDS